VCEYPGCRPRLWHSDSCRRSRSFIPGFESGSWLGLLVPAKTPRPIIERLLADTRAALNSPDVSQSLISQGAEPAGNSPTEFGAYFHAEIKKWGSVIKAAGIKLEQ
jgi:tripartite-type tricarboxylate transporter receptor subunit TctC